MARQSTQSKPAAVQFLLSIKKEAKKQGINQSEAVRRLMKRQKSLTRAELTNSAKEAGINPVLAGKVWYEFHPTH